MAPPAQDAATLQRRSEYLTGILLLLIVVILWTASNFLTNTVLTSGYDKPFFVTYANTSSFALYLVPFLVSPTLRRKVFGGRASARQGGLRLDRIASHGSEADGDGEGWLKKLGFDLPATAAGAGNDGSDAERGAYRPLSTANVEALTVAPTGATAAPRSNSPLLTARPRSTYSNGRRTSLTGTGAIRPNLDRPRSLRASNASLVSHSARPSSIDGRRPRAEIPVFTDLGGGADGELVVAPVPPEHLPPLTLRQTAILAFQFTLVWFGANWSINAGLGLTSVASGTTIGSASGFFTLGLGALLGVDRFTLGRIGAVSMSFVGVMLVTAADAGTSASQGGVGALVSRAVEVGSGARQLTASSSPINAPLGDMLALLSAFLYSIYVMLLKVKIGSEDRISMPLMFGIVGAFNIVALWPIGVLLHVTGVERFALPQDARTWIGVLVNMSITLVSDLVYLMAMLKSSPLASTLGLSLTIPLAVAGDVYRGSHSGGTQAAFGSILVLASFVAIGIADNLALRDEGGVHRPHLPPSLGGEGEEEEYFGGGGSGSIVSDVETEDGEDGEEEGDEEGSQSYFQTRATATVGGGEGIGEEDRERGRSIRRSGT